MSFAKAAAAALLLAVPARVDARNLLAAMLGPTSYPVSYFSNYQGYGVANAPYTLSFSTGKVYNVGTQYFIGNMMSATENNNVFTVPVTGGAGPCPNGAMRSGKLTITCGAKSTSFSVNENPMCTYAMYYSTTQQCPPGSALPPPPASPPPPKLALLGPTNAPVSYFSNYQGTNVPNSPYTLSFSTGSVYNVGTQYFIGTMMTATENLNVFTVPVTGGAGPCPNGAMRQGKLTITCSAASTSFSVNENPMCTYAMYYSTTQQCPPGTTYASPPPPPPSPSPPPPPPSPSPPPPTVYTTTGFVDPSLSTVFRNKVSGTGNNPHIINNGASSSSTETTAQGNVQVKVTTSTTDEDNQGTGNGKVIHRSTDTSTTATAHPRTRLTVITRPSTTDDTEVAPVMPNVAAICAGAAFQIMDQAKNLCLHIKGNGAPGNFQLSAVKRPVITMQCIAGSSNQLFAWVPSATGGAVQHVASGLVITTTQTVVDGSLVTLAPAANSPEQTWAWADYATGGVIASTVNELFEITDAMVNAGANIGLPVHMWHLQKSLPSGQPNANWMATCAN